MKLGVNIDHVAVLREARRVNDPNILNAMFTGMYEVGLASAKTDFFFVNSDFIADKLGEWCKRLMDVTAVIQVGQIKMTFYPVYQVLFGA